MKKLSTIIMALALVLGMSQCKKQETPTNGGDKVYITLNVSNGESIAVNVNDNGGKHAVAPSLGMIQFRPGDVLYVGNNGKYIGQLTYNNNGAFSGTLNAPTSTDFLHFYFVGNAALSEPLPETIGEETQEITSRTISIADQSTNLPVLCYGHSSQPFTGNSSNYTATLAYQCALVRFKLNKATDYKCTLLNMLTEATIDFGTNAITPTATTDTIDLYREEGNTGVRWAILLPGTKLSAAGNVSGTGVNANANSGNVTVNTELKANDFIKSGFTLTNPVFAAPGADYAVKSSDGELKQFSVSSTQKVYFSRANLKCTVGTNQLVWGFHEYQYDECPGFYAITSNSGNTGTTAVHITSSNEMDRFSWGFHSPTKISENDWVDGSRNLNWNDGTDWGCALRGTAYGNYWRTLTAAEWKYLLSSRSGKCFLRASWKQPVYNGATVVNTVITNGIFIAPDGYNGGSTSGYTEWNKADKIHKFTGQGYINLVNELLDAGCVFLPALGYRQDSYYYEYNYHYNMDWYMFGNYWTATGVTQQPNSSEVPQATAFRFEDDKINYAYAPKRNLGMCVRLVWDAN